MIKNLFLFITLTLLCANVSAQIKKSDFLRSQPILVEDKSIWKPFGPMTIAATSACIGGQSLDLVSSNGYEGNPSLRGSDGHIRLTKAISIKLALCAVPVLFDKKLPKWGRVAMRLTQFGIGALGAYDGIRNWRSR